MKRYEIPEQYRKSLEQLKPADRAKIEKVLNEYKELPMLWQTTIYVSQEKTNRSLIEYSDYNQIPYERILTNEQEGTDMNLERLKKLSDDATTIQVMLSKYKHPEKSVRAISADLGIHYSSVYRRYQLITKMIPEFKNIRNKTIYYSKSRRAKDNLK
jgi:hypothetical protein